MTGPATTAREYPVLTGFVCVYVVAFTAFGLLASRSETPVYLVVMVLAALLVSSIHQRVGLSTPVLWAFSIWGLAHMAGGLVPTGEGRVLYNALLGPEPLQYDRFVHAFGYGTASVVVWQTLRARFGSVSSWGVAIICGLAGLGVGLLNEVAEFGMSLVGAENVGGYSNLMGDLIADTIGCATVTVWLGFRGADARVGTSQPGRTGGSGQ